MQLEGTPNLPDSDTLLDPEMGFVPEATQLRVIAKLVLADLVSSESMIHEAEWAQSSKNMVNLSEMREAEALADKILESIDQKTVDRAIRQLLHFFSQHPHLKRVEFFHHLSWASQASFDTPENRGTSQDIVRRLEVSLKCHSLFMSVLGRLIHVEIAGNDVKIMYSPAAASYDDAIGYLNIFMNHQPIMQVGITATTCELPEGTGIAVRIQEIRRHSLLNQKLKKVANGKAFHSNARTDEERNQIYEETYRSSADMAAFQALFDHLPFKKFGTLLTASLAECMPWIDQVEIGGKGIIGGDESYWPEAQPMDRKILDLLPIVRLSERKTSHEINTPDDTNPTKLARVSRPAQWHILRRQPSGALLPQIHIKKYPNTDAAARQLTEIVGNRFAKTE